MTCPQAGVGGSLCGVSGPLCHLQEPQESRTRNPALRFVEFEIPDLGGLPYELQFELRSDRQGGLCALRYVHGYGVGSDMERIAHRMCELLTLLIEFGVDPADPGMGLVACWTDVRPGTSERETALAKALISLLAREK